MTNAERRRLTTTSRVIRPGDNQKEDDDSTDTMTSSERIELVWQLTVSCAAWQRGDESEPRLQRSVSRIQRPEC